MLITLLVYVIKITPPTYITLQTGEDPIVSPLIYKGIYPPYPPIWGRYPLPPPYPPSIYVFLGSKRGDNPLNEIFV